jgi:hypothetical protein
MTHLEQCLFRALTEEWQNTSELRNTVSSAQYRPPLSDVAATLRQLRRRSLSATWVRDRVERTALGTNGHAWRRVRQGTRSHNVPL